MKYLFKYVCKGPNWVTVELIREPVDSKYHEILHFQDVRYNSAFKALWQLYGSYIVERSPPDILLYVHLENYHNLYFGKEEVDSQQRKWGQLWSLPNGLKQN